MLKDPILITGAARSGTSLVAGIIHRHGAVSGETGKEGDQWNPTGYYENYEIIERIDKHLLRGCGLDTLGQTNLPKEPLPAQDIRADVFDIAIGQGIKPADSWYFKDAKLLLLYRSYIQSFPNSKIVLVRRDPSGIVSSCMRTPFMAGRSTPEQWLDWVIDHEKMMEYLRAEHPAVREVWYDDLMKGDFLGIKIVLEWLGFEFDRDIINEIIIKR